MSAAERVGRGTFLVGVFPNRACVLKPSLVIFDKADWVEAKETIEIGLRVSHMLELGGDTLEGRPKLFLATGVGPWWQGACGRRVCCKPKAQS